MSAWSILGGLETPGSWLINQCLLTKSFEPRFLGIMWPSAELRHPERKLFFRGSVYKINSPSFSVLRAFSTSLHFCNELPNPDHFPHREVIKFVTFYWGRGGVEGGKVSIPLKWPHCCCSRSDYWHYLPSFCGLKSQVEISAPFFLVSKFRKFPEFKSWVIGLSWSAE